MCIIRYNQKLSGERIKPKVPPKAQATDRLVNAQAKGLTTMGPKACVPPWREAQRKAGPTEGASAVSPA